MTQLVPMLRGLFKQPGFSLLAILTLALGIGVNVAIFSALEALVLKPLPFPNADRLVAIYEDAGWLGYAKNTPAPANFADWRREATRFDAMAATISCRAVLTGDGAPEEVTCRSMEAAIWPMLGVRPLLGRWFTAEEEHPQPDVALIGEGLWRRRFGEDPNAVGKAVMIGGRAVRIIGVMPQAFRFPQAESELWMPMGATPAEWARRGSHMLTTYGRLKPGVAVEDASRELDAIQRRINAKFPDQTDPRMGALAEPLRDALLGKTRVALWVLMGAAAMVLLIACANVANLLLTRATGRQRELAVRSALGASAFSLLRLLFTETLCLTGAGGGLGVLFALACRGVLESLVPEAMKGGVSIDIDWRVLVFAAGVSFAAALLAAVTPLLHVLNRPLVNLLRQDGRAGGARGAAALRGALVVAEVALTVSLLAGAGLMVRSLVEIWNTEIGFRPEGLLAVRVSLPVQKYANDAVRGQFYRAVLTKLRAQPWVAAADFAATPPFFSIGNSNGFSIEGRTPSGQGEPADMLTREATSGYFETLGARIQSGRAFTEADRAGAPDVVVVNESFEKTYFANSSAIGKRMAFETQEPTRRWRTIVGVVRNINERGFDHFAKPVTYLPLSQDPGGFASFLIVRAQSGDPMQLVGMIQSTVQAVDPNQPISRPRRFDDILNLDQASRRQQMFLLAAFAGLSLAMACLGLYAILAYTVELRRQEIGVRMALGATPGDVMSLILGEGLRMAGLGAILGLLFALAGGRWIESSLFGVKAFDPLTLGSVIGLMLTVAFVACWLPARRAALTPPSISLRQ